MSGYEQFKIHGQIVREGTGTPLTGLLIRAYDVDCLTEDDFLGESRTDRDGKFEITYRKSDFVKNILEVFFEGGPDIVLRIYTPEGTLLHTTPQRSGAHRFEEYLISMSYDDHARRQTFGHMPIEVLVDDESIRQVLAASNITTLSGLAETPLSLLATDLKKKDADISLEQLRRLRIKARIAIGMAFTLKGREPGRQSGKNIKNDIRVLGTSYKNLSQVFPSNVSMALASSGATDISDLAEWDDARFSETLSSWGIDDIFVSMETRRFEQLRKLKADRADISDGLALDLAATAAISEKDRSVLAAAKVATLEDWAIIRRDVKVSSGTGNLLDALTRLRAIGIWGSDAARLIEIGIDSSAALAMASDAEAMKIAQDVGMTSTMMQSARNTARHNLWGVHQLATDHYKPRGHLPDRERPQWPNLPQLIGVETDTVCATCPDELSAYSKFAYFIYLIGLTRLAMNELEKILHQELSLLSPESDRPESEVAQIDLCVQVLSRAYPEPLDFEERLPFLRTQIVAMLLMIRKNISDLAQELSTKPAFSADAVEDVELLLRMLSTSSPDDSTQPKLTYDKSKTIDLLLRRELRAQVEDEVRSDEATVGLSDREINVEIDRRTAEMIEPFRVRNLPYLRGAYKDRSGLSDHELFEKFFIETNLNPCVTVTPLNQAIKSLQAYLDHLQLSSDMPSDYHYLSYESWRAEWMGNLYPELCALWRDDILTGEKEPWDRGSILRNQSVNYARLNDQIKKVREAIKQGRISLGSPLSEFERHPDHITHEAFTGAFVNTTYYRYFEKGLSLIEQVIEADNTLQETAQMLDQDEPGRALNKLADIVRHLDAIAKDVFFPTSPWISEELVGQRCFEELLALPANQRRECLETLADELFTGSKAIYSYEETTLSDQLLQDIGDGSVRSLDSWVQTPASGGYYEADSGTIRKVPFRDGAAYMLTVCRYKHGAGLSNYSFVANIYIEESLNSSFDNPNTLPLGHPNEGECIGIGILHDGASCLRLVIRSKFNDNGTFVHSFYELVLQRVTDSDINDVTSIDLPSIGAGKNYEIGLSAVDGRIDGWVTIGLDRCSVSATLPELPEAGSFEVVAGQTVSAIFGPLSIKPMEQTGFPPFFVSDCPSENRNMLAEASIYDSRVTNEGPMSWMMPAQPMTSLATIGFTSQELKDLQGVHNGSVNPLYLLFPAGTETVWLNMLDKLLDACLARIFYLRFAVVPVRMSQAYLRQGDFDKAIDILHLIYDDRNNIQVYPFLSVPLNESFNVDVGSDVRLIKLRLAEGYLQWAKWLLKSDTTDSRYQARMLCERVLRLHGVEDYCACSEAIGKVTRWINAWVSERVASRDGFRMESVKSLLTELHQARRDSLDLNRLASTMLLAAEEGDKPLSLGAINKAHHELTRQVYGHRSRIASMATFENVQKLSRQLVREAELDLVVSGGLRKKESSKRRHANAAWLPAFPDRHAGKYAGRGDIGRMDIERIFYAYTFCVPTNPLSRQQAEAACQMLEILKGCRNALGLSNGITPEMRFDTLVRQAGYFVELAHAAERDLLNFRQTFEQETYSLMQAQNNLALSKAGVQVEELGVELAAGDISLALSQQNKVSDISTHYNNLISAGLSQHEQDALQSMQMALAISAVTAAPAIGTAVLGAALTASGAGAPIGIALTLISDATAVGGSLAGVLQTKSQLDSMQASYERREQEWAFQAGQARWDTTIAHGSTLQALRRYNMALARKSLEEMRRDFTADGVQFLSSKVLNAAMWLWMMQCAREQYRTRLDYAISTAFLAERALAFEQQNPRLEVIRFDYYDPRKDGLLGATQLQTDIATLQAQKLNNTKRKLQLSKTLSLRSAMPVEFQRFRSREGRLVFSTMMEWFDMDFPGHYLRLINNVRVTVLALVPPAEGIHATLSSSGISRVVVKSADEQAFREITVRRNPETIALSSPYQASGLFQLDYKDDLLLPFEGSGVAMDWVFDLPKASNQFNFDTIADVFLTMEYTALNNDDYRQIVTQRLDSTMKMDLAFSLAQDFPDVWYHFYNPVEISPSGNSVLLQFNTERKDFPTNLAELKILAIVLYFDMRDGSALTERVKLRFVDSGGSEFDYLDGQPENNILSSRSLGNVFNDINKPPFGEWTIELQDRDRIRNHLLHNDFKDIILAITFKGESFQYP